MPTSRMNPASEMARKLSALDSQPITTACRMSLSHRSPGSHPRQRGGRLARPLVHVDFAARVGKNNPTAVDWRRMVIYRDPTGAVCRAVTSLYRRAWRAAGRPQNARLYLREVV